MHLRQIRLMEAVSCGNNADIAAMLAEPLDLDFHDDQGTTPLCVAAKCRPDIVKRLCAHGASVNFTGPDRISALHWAVEFDNDETIAVLLGQGADVHALDRLAETPLHWACWTGHAKSARLLLKAGADPHRPNAGGRIPFDLARLQDHPELLSLLAGA